MTLYLYRVAPLLALCCFVMASGCSRGNSAEGGPGRGPGGAQTIPVSAEKAQHRDLARRVTVTGPIEPIRSVSVNAQTAGTVERVIVEEGNRVTSGQLMAELDAREIRAQLDRAEAVLENAEAVYQRTEQLRANDLTSTAELDAARSAFAIAKADVELWRTRLAFTRITAPVAGVVTGKSIERGSAVSTNQSMFEIADDALLVVRVRVSELDVVHLNMGSPVTVALDAYPDAEITGSIRRIFPSAEPGSRLVPVEISLGPRPKGVDARPGFLARVEFAVDYREGVLAVPASAVGMTDGAPYVYIVEGDTLVRRIVDTGLTAGGWIEVTEGIEAGEQVVSSGQVNLRAGARVKVSGGDTPAQSKP
jgi:membrane fusion protein (multidrug efflux system)